MASSTTANSKTLKCGLINMTSLCPKSLLVNYLKIMIYRLSESLKHRLRKGTGRHLSATDPDRALIHLKA